VCKETGRKCTTKLEESIQRNLKEVYNETGRKCTTKLEVYNETGKKCTTKLEGCVERNWKEVYNETGRMCTTKLEGCVHRNWKDVHNKTGRIVTYFFRLTGRAVFLVLVAQTTSQHKRASVFMQSVCCFWPVLTKT
jgi:hypothetical protein